MSRPEPLRVRLLGGLGVEGLADRELGTRKGRTVLKVLALARGEPVSTDRLADVLWGDDQPSRPADQVGVLVSRLRGVLGAERLVRADGGYRLLADWLDVDEVEARAVEAASALDAGRVGAARAAATAALALARGPLLPDDEGEWLDAPRASLDVAVERARAVAMEAAVRSGDHAGAAALAEAGLARDPYDEAALRVLMRAHAAGGRPGSALAAYAKVRDRLAEDLGLSPTADTEALHDAIVMTDGRDLGASGQQSSRSPELLGRAGELAALDEAFASFRAGTRTCVVSVVGEAGIGKSALVDTWVAAVGRTGVAVAVGRCDEMGQGLPLQPVLDALAGLLAGRDPEATAAILGDDAPVLVPLLGGPAPDEQGATVLADPDEGRTRLFAAILGALVRAGEGGPLVLVIEDVQLAGPATRSWLAFASRRPSPVLVVATGRPDATPLAGAATIPLGPVGVEVAQALVGPRRAADLLRRSGGNPLLLHALADAPDEAALPASVTEAVHSWVLAIGDAGPTVEAAAVLGADVDLDLLADVLTVPAVELLVHLEAAERVGILVERGAGFAFRHELVRGAVEASLRAPRRALLHRSAAGALARRPTAEPLSIAAHASAGGDRPAAIAAYVRAAREAVARFDLDAADVHLDAALVLGPSSAEALTARARVEMFRGDLVSAERDVAAAIDAGGAPDTLEVAGWVSYYRRRYDEAMARADEGVVRATDPAVRGSCLSVGGRARHGAGDLAGAAARLEEAASASVVVPVRGVAEIWLAQARLHQGRPAEALDGARRALVDPDRLAHPFAVLHGRFTVAMALGHLGRVEEALAECDELDRVIVRGGVAGERFAARSENVRAWLMRWTGREMEADDTNARAVEHTEGASAQREAHYAGLLDLADGRVLAGDLDAASGLEARLAPMDSWTGTMAWYQHHRLELLRSRLALADGDRDAAAALAAATASDAGGRGARRHELVARAHLGLAGGASVVELDAVVAELGVTSGLDGWRLVAELATAFDHDGWLAEATRRADRLALAAGPAGESTRALAARFLPGR